MAIERFFHGLWSNGTFDVLASIAAQFALYACVAVAALAWLRRKPERLLLPAVIAGVVVVLLDLLAGSIFHEARPFIRMGVTPLVPHDNDNGFPSDHSAAAAFVATIALFIDPALGVVAWLFAFALGIGRTFCLLHTPLDVVAGWAIGAVPACAAGLFWRRARRSQETKTVDRST
jgi:membrane-associated phospholipid phosphatase